MNEEIMNLIHEKCGYIKNIRNENGRIQVQIPWAYDDSLECWIEIFEAPSSVEKVITKWLSLGGKVC